MESSPKAAFRGTARFEILAELGFGAAGVVYEALDRERDERVALKTLQSLNPDAVLRFKTEFRALQHLEHPNLVSLGEMFEHEGLWFFTMELLEGVPFLDYINGRNSANFDEPRLRHALTQLVRGVSALHRAEKVHRDVKPSNVMMTPRGRGVLLDFGLVAAPSAEDQPGHVVGTVAYMAPEQSIGQPVGPAADWYSVGVVLYEALTGRLPFTGSRMDVLSNKHKFEPAPPRAVVPGVPVDLDALCAALLHHEPDARPDHREIMRRLNIDPDRRPGGTTLSSAGQELPFVGRALELGILTDALDSALASNAVAVTVRGPSGVGKSHLVRRFLDGVRRSPAPPLILEGRCYERESVPFKAFDGVIDALSRHLVSLPEADATALVEPSAAWIGRVFPVLRRAEAVAKARADDVLDPHEQRTRMFAAVRAQLRRLAAARPLIVLIDDLHWADADSMALLANALREPDAPPLLLIATARPGVDVSSMSSGDVRDIDLSNLPPDRARELAARLLAAHGVESDSLAQQLANEAGGHPLFIGELVHSQVQGGDAAPGTLRLDDALWARINRLEPDARKILEVLAVAAGPISQRTAARVAMLGAAAFNRHVALLRVAQLVRTSGAQTGDAIETYHDRVREAVAERLTPDDIARWHGRLAVALEASGEGDAETLAHHLRFSGDVVRAAEAAQLAADAAAETWAFDRAARLYQLTLDLATPTGDARRALLRKLAGALADAGRGPEAAHTFLAAADGGIEAHALECRRRAAEQLLSSGHVDEGMAVLATVLDSVGMKLPPTATAAMLPLIRGRIATRLRGLRFEVRDATHVSVRNLARIDVCWTAAALTGFVDFVRSGLFQTTHLRLALAAGEPYRVSRALAVESALVAAAGGSQRYITKVATTAAELAARVGDPHAIAIARGTRGIASYLRCEWRDALGHLEVTETMLREKCTGVTWELESALLMKVNSRFFVGDLVQMRREAAAYIQHAVGRGDVYGATNLRSGFSNFAWLIADDPAAARLQADDAIAAWSHQGYHAQHLMNVVAQVAIDLYEGDAQSAALRVEQMWPLARKAQLLRVQQFRVFAYLLRAQTALACGDVRSAARVSRKLHREGTRASRAWAALVRAALDCDPGSFRAAAAQLDHADMLLYAVAARWRAGDDAATRWLDDQGVAAPERVVEALCPALA